MRILKKLSANDLGTTGGHQAGILVPKVPEILSFFPRLSDRAKNPRAPILVHETRTRIVWRFNFIHYNNRQFGGTRNEYRLTGMTRYLRSAGAVEGDEIEFRRDEDGSIHMGLVRQNSVGAMQLSDGVLVLRGGWVCINR